MAGPACDTRHAETAFKGGALGGFERRHAAVGPSEDFGAVVRGENDDSVVSLADVIEVLQDLADAVIHLRHAGLFDVVVVGGVHHRLVLGRYVSEHVHARGVVPDEERLAVTLRLVHEIVGVLDQYVVEGLHVVLGFATFLPVLHVLHVRKWRQRTLIHDLLLSDFAPARHSGVVVRVRRPAMR